MDSLRCGQLNEPQPGSTGIQNVANRYRKTPGDGDLAGQPAAVSPPISAASTAPAPPGVGAALAIDAPAK